MKKIMMALLLFVLIVSHYHGNVFSEFSDEKSNLQAPLIDPALEKELHDIGVTSEMLMQDPYNFYDGDFELSGRITRAIMADKLFKNDPQYREELKQQISSATTLFFPWDSTGTVKLVNKEDNTLAELYRKGVEDVSVSEVVAFKKKDASIEFDLEVVEANSDDALEVLLYLPTEEESAACEILLANYLLSRLSQNNHLIMDLSRNKLFVDKLKELEKLEEVYKRSMEIVFRLKAKKNKASTTIIHLDNIKITYVN